MSGVSLEDPFLLAEFATTASQDQALSVQCTAAGEPKNTADAFSETSDSSEDQDANLLAVAVQGEGVQLYNTADQNCIYSYSTPPGFTFQCPAKTISKGKGVRHVYAVIGKGTDITAKEEGKIVWMWRDESATLKKAGSQDTDMDVDGESAPASSRTSTATKTVKKFDHKIHELFVSSALPNHIILVNSDASLSLVTDDMKRVVATKVASQPLSNSGLIAWTSAFNSTNSWIPTSILARNTVVVATITADASNMTIAFSYVNEDLRGLSVLGQVTLEEQDGYHATAIAFDTTAGQLSYLSAKGQLKIFNIDMIIKDRKITATETLSLPLPGFISKSATSPAPSKSKKKSSKAASGPTDGLHQRTASLALGNNYIAIAGIHEMEGQSEQTLTVWDARYGTLQAKHIIPGSHNAHQTSCQLSVAPDSAIAVTFSTPQGNTVRSRVHLCSFYSEPVSLLSAMGRMKATAPFFGLSGSADATGALIVSQESFSATTTSLLTPSSVTGVIRSKDLTLTDFEKRVEQTQQAENKVLESLLSVQGGKSTNADAFSKLFFEHVEKQTAIALQEVMEKYHVNAGEAQAAVSKDEERKKNKHPKAASAAASDAMEVDTPQPDAKKEAGEANGLDKKTKKQLRRQKKKAAAAAAAAAAATAPTVAPATTSTADYKEETAAAEGSESESSSEDEDDEDEEAEEHADRADQSSEDEFEDALEDEDDATEQARMQAYLEAMGEWRKSEAEAIKQFKDFRRHLRAGRKQVPLPELSHRFLSTILGRCFHRLPNGQPDMSFWPEKVVQYLIEKQLVGNSNPGAGQVGIALELMEREQWQLLETALKRLYDIPEMDLVTLLKQVLGLNKAGGALVSDNSNNNKVPTSEHFLSLILSAPKNEVFLQQALKKLTVEELAIVLEILKRWIQEWEERGGLGHGGQRADKKHLSGDVPGYSQIVDFTTALMDVHFPSLILSPHLHETLRYIHSSIQTEVSVSQLMEQVLRGPLGLFERKYRDSMRRKKEIEQGALNQGPQGPNVIGGGSRVSADKRRRRKWEGGEGIPDYGVEIIHM